MDTETVLQIIEIIENRIFNLTYEHTNLQCFMIADDYSAAEIKEAGTLFKAKKKALLDVRDHLQEYIELQVSQIEGV